jgi:ribosomal protein S18 acetylase RimI-like enzyme
VAANPLARSVKLADLADNLSNNRALDPVPAVRDRIERYERAVRRLGQMPPRAPVPADITIRRWTRRDHADVLGLLRLLSPVADIRNHDAPAYVAEDGGQLVGMVTLCVYRTLTGPKAYLDHLVVAPGKRRRGIGRALVRHAIQQAAAEGASRIDLTAHREKRAGRGLYESLGFRERDTGSFRLQIPARRTAQAR